MLHRAHPRTSQFSGLAPPLQQKKLQLHLLHIMI